MQTRMKNPALLFPAAMESLQALSRSTEKSGLSPKIVALAHLRASQINGCSACVEMAPRHKPADETMERLFAVTAWREMTCFTEQERAALALTECVTRLSDRSDPVPDEIWNEATKHFDEKQLGALILAIAATNVWNRLNVTTKQMPGNW